MHLNESPYPPSPRAAEAVVALLAGLNRYPAVRGRQLAEALAAQTGVPVEMPHRLLADPGGDRQRQY